MPRTVNDVVQQIKNKVDNDSFMYVFKNSAMSESYKRSVLHANWGDGSTYYTKCVSPRIIKENIVNIYYKNTNGVWINYIKYINTFPNENLLTGAVNRESIVKIDNSILPPTLFMDENKYVYYIDAQDGNYGTSIVLQEIDESDGTKVLITPYSIEEPNLPQTARHMMQDLKIKITNVPNNTILVWLNGAFVPIIRDNVYEDVFYIHNALTMINTRCINQTIDAPVNNVPTGTFRTATIQENEEFNEYRYDIKIRFFKWKNVNVADWKIPITTLVSPIIYNYAAIYIPTTLIFDTPINTKAHMLLENGVVLDPSEYDIDPLDNRRVTLKTVIQRGYNLLNEVVEDIRNHPDIYLKMTPLNLIKHALTEKVYNLVNFSTTEINKTLYLKRSIACAVDFPYRNEITFSDINNGDLILIDGTFTPYEWVHKYTVRIPLQSYTYQNEDIKTKETSVARLHFVTV